MVNRKNLRESGLYVFRNHESMAASHGGLETKTELAIMNSGSKRQVLGFFGLFEPLKSLVLLSIMPTFVIQGQLEL